MSVLLLIVVLVLVVVFGAASMMQSYATAKQADAVIETAQAAQMATFGNVAVILLLVIVVLAVLFAVMYIAVRGLPTPARRVALPHFSRKSERPIRYIATSRLQTRDIKIANDQQLPVAFSRDELQRILAEMNALDESDEYADLYEEDAR